jgi:MFS family permease
MDWRHPISIADRCAFAIAGGCFGLVLGTFLSMFVATLSVVWYTAAYFSAASFMLGPAAADIVAMVLAAVSLLFQTVLGPPVESGYEKNPFDKPWHWLLLALFIIGLVAVVVFAAREPS